MQNIAILGSTGSIGRQALDVISRHPDRYRAVALAARSSAELLQEQVRVFRPETAVLTHPPKGFGGTSECEWNFGEEALLDVCARADVDAVLVAVVGIAGLPLVLRAVACGKKVLLANKEALVTGGELVMRAAKEKNVPLLPVDSEHSAIFQCLNGEYRNKIDKILLTASGGPFRGWTRKQMERVQVEDALKHPNWSMGRKITIDSSTMVNKGLEVMEARWLFDVDLDRIQVVVQPKSIIHSMVQFEDGAVMAQLGTPDMKLPIQYALYYPERRPLAGDRLDFWKLTEIAFEKPDPENFRGLALAYEAGKAGGSMPVVFNAANEFAVAEFLDRRAGYLEITDMIAESMAHHTRISHPSLEQVLEAEQETYEFLRRRQEKNKFQI